jgi:hypothetical protein
MSHSRRRVAALTCPAPGGGDGPRWIRYIQIGIGGPAALGDAAAAYDILLKQVAAGGIGLDVDRVPLAEVE